MRTGKALILATKPFAVDDRRRSWWCVLSTGGLLLAALAGTLANVPFVGRLTGSVLAGLLILRFFVIYHDQQHHAILPHSRLADALRTAFGIYSLSPSTIWKASHHHHHHNSKLAAQLSGVVKTSAPRGGSHAGRTRRKRFLRVTIAAPGARRRLTKSQANSAASARV